MLPPVQASAVRSSVKVARPGVERLSAVEPQLFADTWFEISHPGHFWFGWRWQAARRLLEDCGLSLAAPIRALDVGCGTGILRAQIEAAGGWTVDGADLDDSALLRAPEGRGRRLFYDLSERRPELVASYDAVLVFDVVEHVGQPRAFLSAALDHVRPGGWLFLDVPAIQGCFSAYDLAVGHLRRYDRATLAAEVSGLKCQVVDVRYWGLAMVPLLIARKLVAAFQRSAERVIATGFKPPGRWVESVLAGVGRLETALCKRPPLGASLLLAARKEDQDGSLTRL